MNERDAAMRRCSCATVPPPPAHQARKAGAKKQEGRGLRDGQAVGELADLAVRHEVGLGDSPAYARRDAREHQGGSDLDVRVGGRIHGNHRPREGPGRHVDVGVYAGFGLEGEIVGAEPQ